MHKYSLFVNPPCWLVWPFPSSSIRNVSFLLHLLNVLMMNHQRGLFSETVLFFLWLKSEFQTISLAPLVTASSPLLSGTLHPPLFWFVHLIRLPAPRPVSASSEAPWD